jgi:hypothetical protein
MREAWKHFYDTAFWQRRRKLQLTAHPLCKMCAARGVVTLATIADHIEPHKGNWNLFATGDCSRYATAVTTAASATSKCAATASTSVTTAGRSIPSIRPTERAETANTSTITSPRERGSDDTCR